MTSINGAYVAHISLSPLTPPPQDPNAAVLYGQVAKAWHIADLAYSTVAAVLALSPVGKGVALAEFVENYAMLMSLAAGVYEFLSKLAAPDQVWEKIYIPEAHPINASGLPTNVAAGLTTLDQIAGLAAAIESATRFIGRVLGSIFPLKHRILSGDQPARWIGVCRYLYNAADTSDALI